MRHPESQRFYQSSGGGPLGPVAPQVGPVAVPGPNPDDPPWQNRDEWMRLKKQGLAPLPTSAMPPDSMSDRDLLSYYRSGSAQDVLPTIQSRAGQYGLEGKRLTVPGAAGAGAQPNPYAMTSKPFTGQQYMSVGGTPGKYSKADVQREGALASRQRGQAAVFAQQRDAFTKDMVQQSYGWIQAAQNEQKAAGAEAATARDEYLKASRAIQTNRARLEKMEIDPDRYWKNLPESQKVLNVIGLIFGGLAEGFSQGRVKNAAAAAIKNAQERDMAAQNANMKKMIQTIDMDDRDRASMWGRWQAGEARRRAASLLVMQTQLSRAGLMEKRLGIKEQYAGIINQLDAHMLDVLRQSRGRGGRMVETPEYKLELEKQKMTHGADLQLRNQSEVARIKATGTAAKKDRGENAIQKARAALPRLREMYENMPLIKGDYDTSGISQAYERERTRTSIGLWRMFDSGKLSDFDMVTAMKVFFPKAKWGNSLEQTLVPALDLKEAHGRAFNDVETFLNEAETRVNQGIQYRIPPERKEQIRRLWLANGMATE
jgi:hypothetical protein